MRAQTDYFHTPYFQLIEDLYDQPPVFLPSDNNLINGKMDLDCDLITDNTTCPPNAKYSKFTFITNKIHRLRLINAGSSGTQKFTIDNHKMIIIANDFVPIQPYETKIITLGVGQRSDVLVEATGKPTDIIWMRSDLDQGCFPGGANQPHALAAIYYSGADPNDHPNTTATPWKSVNCSNVKKFHFIQRPNV